MLQPGALAGFGYTAVLAASGAILSVIAFALGVAFWLLGTDRRAGIIFDAKGLMLNLGHSAAFVSWENIDSVGLTQRRFNLLALGSSYQLGIRLHNPEEYLQSYEVRIPASQGLLAQLIRLLARSFSSTTSQAPPSPASLDALRRQTGYDLLVPEAQLGGRAAAFVEMIEAYRKNPTRRRMFQIEGAAQSL